MRVAQGARIAVLGVLRIGGVRPKITPKDQVVLEALCIRPGDAVSTDWLSDALWGQSPPASAAKNLQSCVAKLRKVLGHDAIETTASGYRLTLAPEDIDSHAFELHVRRGRELLALHEPDRAAYVLDEALAMYVGEPFEDLSDWDPGIAEAARLLEIRLGAEELLIDALLAAGQHEGALPRASSWVRDQPLRERRHVQLAVAQYRTGQQAEALGTLRQLRERLLDELAVDPGAEVTALEQAILRQDPELLVMPPSGEGTTCPWPGLTSYDVEDHESFCGRDAETAACIRLIRDRGVLAVVGPSGSGKSSLLRAGVAAALQVAGRDVSIVTPGRAGPSEADAVTRTPIGTVLIVDQLEEAFAPGVTPQHRVAYLDALAHRGGGGELVVALRADRTPELSAEPGVARLLERGWYLLSAMDAAELRTAIERPARQAGLLVEPGLVDLLLREVLDEPGALPVLSHSLVETWNRREGRTLTVDGYLATGGARGSIAKSAEAVYAEVPVEERGPLRDLLMRLVVPGPEGQPTRIKVPRDRAVTHTGQERLIERLVGSRLLTSDDGNITLAHEALAREWPRLRGWLDDDIEGQRILQHLSATAYAWNAMGSPDSELYRGVRLAQVVEWRAGSETELAPVEQRFFDESLRLRSAEERSTEERARMQVRANRRLRVLLAASVALLLVVAWLGALAKTTSNRAEEAAIAREADAVGARALITSDIPKSLLLAAAAARVSPATSTGADLAAALAQRGGLVAATPGAGAAFAQLAVSPAGTRLDATGVDGGVYLYDALSLELLDSYQAGRREPGGLRFFMPVAFSPDGTTVAVGVSAPAEPPVRLLSVSADRLQPAGVQPSGWPSYAVRTSSVSFSADGRRLAVFADAGDVSSDDRAAALIWDTRRLGRPLTRIAVDAAATQKVLLSPDGSRLYTTSPPTAYDVVSGRRLYRRPSLDSWQYADLNPSGTLLALLGFTNEKGVNDVWLVRAEDGKVRRRLTGMPPGFATSLAFSPRGSRVAAYGGDGTVYVWDWRSGELSHTITTADDFASGLAFGPDGSTLYTAGPARELLEWDVAGYRSFLQRVDIPNGVAFDVGYQSSSPDGTNVAYFGGDDRGPVAGILDVDTGRNTSFALNERTSYSAVAWSPDENRVALLAAPRSVQVRDPRTGRRIATGRVGGDIYDLSYTGDGQTVLVAAGSTVEVLDARTLERRAEPLDVGDQVMSVDASPDGTSAFLTLLAKPWDGSVQRPPTVDALVDLRTRRIVYRARVPIRNVFWAAFSPRGDQIAVVGDGGQVGFLDPATGRAVAAPADTNGSRVNWVSYSPDGSRLLTADRSDARLWDTTTGQEIGVVSITGASGGFQADDTLMLADSEGQLFRWDPSVEHALEFACDGAGRDISRVEWQEAFPDLAYRSVCPGT